MLLNFSRMKHEASNYEKGRDTMDVWFDSGSSWASVVEANEELSYPADLYLEGSDQVLIQEQAGVKLR